MAVSVSHISAGVTAVFVGYSSAAVLILQAIDILGGGPAEQSSWLFAIGVGMGLSSIGLSWWYKTPILTAWSTPGIALLATALAGASLAEAVGVFLFSAFLVVLCGMSGIFDRIVKVIPKEIAAALLAGILLQFELAVVPALKESPLIVSGLILTYFVMKRLTPKWVFGWMILVAIVLSIQQQSFASQYLQLAWPQLVWVWPKFNLNLILGIGLPLFLVTMVSQNLPGLMTLHANGYTPPASRLLTVTGITTMIFAPLGAFAINLAAITASICQTDEVDPDPAQRYKSVVVAGVTYTLAGIMGVSIVGLFIALPNSATIALAGLALLHVVTSSLAQALSHPGYRESAVLTFIVTASGVNFWDLNSAFWGLLTGLLSHYLFNRYKAEETTEE